MLKIWKKKNNQQRKEKLHKKRENYLIGKLSEYLVALFLIFKLYIPLKIRYKNKFGEIDLICYKNNTIYFFEIKYRSDLENLENVVSEYQKNRIIKASENFMQNKKHLQKQIDFILLTHKFPFIYRYKNITL